LVVFQPNPLKHITDNTIPGCEPAQLVSALNSEDAGTLNHLNGLYEFPADMIAAAFGNNPDVEVSKIGKKIPDVGTGSVMGSAECMRRCGIEI
jgi:hypothetical protein